MIDPKIFAELQNRGIITVVGLEPTQFENLEALKNLGLATSIAAEAEYKAAVEKLIDMNALLEKFLADIAAGGEVDLPMDITITAPIVIEKDVVLNLNGYTITVEPWDEDGEANAYAFWVKAGNLVINGNGTINATDAIYSMAVWANGGNVEINGGTYKNGGDSCDLIYASKSGNIVINDGTFIAAGPASGTAPGTKNPHSALNIKDANRSTCSISVKGGKFFKFNPADNLSENPKMSFVADGYEVVTEGDYFVVRKAEDIVVDDNVEVTE